MFGVQMAVSDPYFVVQSLSHVLLYLTPRTVAHQTLLTFTVSQSLLKLMSIEPVMPSNHLILCHSLLLLPSIFPRIRILSSKSALHTRWPKYWSFSISISPSNEYSGFICYRFTGLISLQSNRLSRLFSSTTVSKHQLFCAEPSSWSNFHIHTWLLEKPLL